MLKKIFIILISFYSLNAQNFDGASLGMAGNYSALSKGINSISWNPANLALIRGNSTEINFISMQSGLYNNSFSIYEYNRYFTPSEHNGFWSEYDKNAILNTIHGDGLQINTDVAVNLFGFAYNNIAFAAQIVEQGYNRISQNTKPFEIALFGESLTKDYEYIEPKAFETEIYSAIKLSLGYAYPVDLKIFPGFYLTAVGMNFNYFIGTAVGQVLDSEISGVRKIIDGTDIIQYHVKAKMRYTIPGEMTEENEDYEFDETSGYTTGGGVGIDLGTSFNFAKDWDISWSFSNLFASIDWSTNGLVTYQTLYDSLGTSDLFNGKDGDNHFEDDSTMRIGAFSTPLPSIMRLGVAYSLRENLVLTAEYRQGLDSYFGNTTSPQLGMGVEYIINNMFPLRTGITFGGKYGYLFGLGTGFHRDIFHFDISTAFSRAVWPSASTGFFTSLSFKFLF